ncbi:hypothetical protein LEP1GSC127_4953 [Leptospira kirschneri str. 200801925]|nr:hypothetical protein LEP1GSC127_4953 [Leptospira kirschneri str. 200801925]
MILFEFYKGNLRKEFIFFLKNKAKRKLFSLVLLLLYYA